MEDKKETEENKESNSQSHDSFLDEFRQGFPDERLIPAPEPLSFISMSRPVITEENMEPPKADLFSYLTSPPEFIESAESFKEKGEENYKYPEQAAGVIEVVEQDAELEQKMSYVKQALLVIGHSQLGDLYNPTLKEIRKTIDCVYTLVRQRQMDLEFRRRHSEVIQKYKNELMIINKKYELLQRENERLKRVLGKAENDLHGMREKVKVTAVGYKNDKEDYRQTMTKMEQKVAQISHELRKKDANFVKMQEKYRKIAKDGLFYKNGFDITAKLSADGLDAMYRHVTTCEDPSLHNLILMLKGGYEQTQWKLLDENNNLKECLKYLQDELAHMLNQVIDKLNCKLAGKETRCLDPIHVKPIVFQMTLGHVLNDIYQIFRENICRMRDALEIILNLLN